MKKIKTELFKKASDSKNLWSDEWISVKQTDGFTFVEQTKGNNGVAVLLYKQDGDKVFIAGRYEKNPPHKADTQTLASLTGGVDKGNSIEETAILESKEEAGVDIVIKDLINLGTVFPWKSSAACQHLFAVDCNDKDLGEAEGDGSSFEEGAYCEWISIEEAIKSEDPILHALILRAYQKDLFKI